MNETLTFSVNVRNGWGTDLYPPKITDETEIHCEDCGSRLGTFGELKKRVARQVAPSGSVPNKRPQADVFGF